MDGESINRGNIILTCTSFDDESILCHCVRLSGLALFNALWSRVTGRIWIKKKSFWYLNANIWFQMNRHLMCTVFIIVRNIVLLTKATRWEQKSYTPVCCFCPFRKWPHRGAVHHTEERNTTVSLCWRECISSLRMFLKKFTHNGNVGTAHVGPIWRSQ